MEMIRSARLYLRTTPFDVNTEEGRAAERYRLAILSIFANVLSKGLSILVMVLSVSLTLPYLGAERFGIWMTIASFSNMLSFLDLGVGNALTNHIAQVAASNNSEKLRRAISGGLGFLLLMGTCMAGGLWIVAEFLPWERLIKMTDLSLVAESRQSAQLFAMLFGFNLFTSGLQRIFAGQQRSFEAHVVAALGSVMAIIGIFFATRYHSSIPVLLVVTLGSQSAAALVLLLILVRRRQFQLSGIFSAISTEKKCLLNTGFLFFVLQIGTMIGWGADNLIISSFRGVGEVAVFSVVQRLFLFATMPLGMINAPLWGAYADASARGDKIFIRKTLERSMAFTACVSIIAAVCLYFGGPVIVAYWTKSVIVVPISVLAIYAVWSVLSSCADAFAMFMNGCNIIRPQMWGVVSLCLLSIPLKILLISKYGLGEMLMGFIFVFSINIFVFYGLIFKKEIRKFLVAQ